MSRPHRPWPALSSAERSVLVDVLVNGPASRAHLSRRLALSPASLTRITRLLVVNGILTETGVAPADRPGRPSMPMDVMVDAAHLIGVNLTATALHLVRTDLRARIIEQRDIELSDTSPESVADTIGRAVEEQRAQDLSLLAIGISLAGPVSPASRIVRTSPFLGWADVPLVQMVKNRTDLPTFVENDVRALTAAEHWFGAAAGCSDFVLVTIGSGVGCGMVIDHRLVEGVVGGSGQVGHLPITASGPLCERGHRGCVRSYLASSSIISQVSIGTGRTNLRYDDVLDLSVSGEPVARRVVTDAATALGQLIGTLAAVSSPQKVLISGEGVRLAELMLDLIREEAARAQHWTLEPVDIEISPFTFTEWARGAAVMALRRQWEPGARLNDD